MAGTSSEPIDLLSDEEDVWRGPFRRIGPRPYPNDWPTGFRPRMPSWNNPNHSVNNPYAQHARVHRAQHLNGPPAGEPILFNQRGPQATQTPEFHPLARMSINRVVTHHVEQPLVSPKLERAHVRSCFNCIEDKKSCDGEQPCSACAEPELDCDYPGETPKRKVRQLPVLQNQNRAPSPGKHQSRSHAIELALSDTGSGNNDAAVTDDFLRIADDDVFEEEADATDDIGMAIIDADSVKSLLRRQESRMKAHREYITQAMIRRAKTDAAQAKGAPKLSGKHNPFSKLIEEARRRNVAENSPGTVTIGIRSSRQNVPRKWLSFTIPVIVVKTNPTILPKYKSIGRLSYSILARNTHLLKYLPYFPELEDAEQEHSKKVKEVQKWFPKDGERMRKQRRCSELAASWRYWIQRAASMVEIQLRDILYFLVFSCPEERRCELCDMRLAKEQYKKLLRSVSEPSEQALARARYVVTAMKDLTKLSLWHIVTEIELVKQASKSHTDVLTLCSVCFLHNCLLHGQYQEPDDNKSASAIFKRGDKSQATSDVTINDEESELNTKVSMVTAFQIPSPQHICSLFCVDGETQLTALLGLHPDGTIKGIYNRNSNAARPGLPNDKPCGSFCFWTVERRTRFGTVLHTKHCEVQLDPDDQKMFHLLVQIYATNQRAPCMIARALTNISCIDAFYYMLCLIQLPTHIDQAQVDAEIDGARTPRLSSSVDVSFSKALEKRPPFFPCSHEGPCHNNPNCSCSRDAVHCERFCGCHQNCNRRFKGCNCGHTNKMCFNDDRCECWAMNRECDPWLCGECGASEVLDPANRYNEAIRRGRCRNVKIQLDLPARTFKAPSDVQGWGLYAGEDIEKEAYIGEYKGELIGKEEGDRRGAVYHINGLEYLFKTNSEQELDGSNFGNKTRFINNSQLDKFINVDPKVLFCNGITRIMLYARTAIKAGEELLYNYGYSEEVTRNFWEKGQGAPGPGNILAKPLIPPQSRGKVRMAKSAHSRQRKPDRSGDGMGHKSTAVSAQDRNGHAESPSHQQYTRPRVNGRFVKDTLRGSDSSRSSSKRKRDSEDKRDETGDDAALEGDEIPESDQSDFVNDHATGALSESESSSSEPASSASDSDSEESTSPAPVERRRRINPGDRRFGGEAQRRAWQSRKSKVTTN